MVEIETATFWQDSPEVQRGELAPDEIGTEVFFFPAAGARREGRLLHEHAAPAAVAREGGRSAGRRRSEAWFVYQLGRRLKARAAGDTRPRNARPERADVGLPDRRAARRARHRRRCCRRSTAGRPRRRRARRRLHAAWRPTASTACGCWIYSGVYPAAGPQSRARARRRRSVRPRLGIRLAGRSPHPLQPRVGAARRHAVERAQEAGLVGRRGRASGPGSTRRTSPATRRRRTCRRRAPRGDAALRGDAPFIMHADGLGWLWVPAASRTGRCRRTTSRSNRRSATRCIASRRIRPPIRSRGPTTRTRARPAIRDYPHVLTTYRLTEHHTAGGMSRTLSHLAELQPALFCEISPELAREIGVENGERVRVSHAARRHRRPRARHAAAAAARRRRAAPCIRSACPIISADAASSRGDVVNDLVAISEEPNVRIMESKALLCR